MRPYSYLHHHTTPAKLDRHGHYNEQRLSVCMFSHAVFARHASGRRDDLTGKQRFFRHRPNSASPQKLQDSPSLVVYMAICERFEITSIDNRREATMATLYRKDEVDISKFFFRLEHDHERVQDRGRYWYQLGNVNLSDSQSLERSR